jgi:NAD+ diphosphatase
MAVFVAMDIPLPDDPITFGGNQLDRAALLRQDEAAIDAFKSHKDASVLPLWDLRGLIDIEIEPILAWQPLKQLRYYCPDDSELLFLGLDGETPRFAIGLDDERDPAKDGQLNGRGKFMDVRTVASQLSAHEAGVLAHARSVIDWHSRHRFCANCGAKTNTAAAGNTRECPDCKTQHFPRTDPVSIMLVVKGDKCLLGRKAMFPPGMYSALAGFIEPGETIEDAVRREVLEESGIQTSQVRYIFSQPWPFPSSLMMGCIAEATSEEITIDEDELEHAGWFTRAEIEEALERSINSPPGDGLFRMPHPIAIAHHLIRAWLLETA